MPHLQRLYNEFQGKGLELVAVNAADTEEVIRNYMDRNGFTFKIVLGGPFERFTLGSAYGVRGFPSNYLIDGDGKIVWRAFGFDESALRDALARAGLR